MFSKIGVTHVPPALFCALRFTIAGILLTAFARLVVGDAVPRGLGEWRHVLVMGLLMVFASNGLNAWAIQYIPTNESALLNGTAAFWIAGFGIFGKRGHPLTRRAIFGLVIGFLGTVLILLPKGDLRAEHSMAPLGALGSCLAWSLGTLYYRSIDTRMSPLMLSALQLLAGGLLFAALALARGDFGLWVPNAPGLLALAYLTLFSSCLAFTAYGWLTLHAKPTLIGTYGYVNPAIAAYLGWQFLDERLSRPQVLGMIIILVGVVLLTLPGSSLLDAKNLDEPKAQ
jgi:drug/metabolite transporter (DMT)-like permease